MRLYFFIVMIFLLASCGGNTANNKPNMNANLVKNANSNAANIPVKTNGPAPVDTYEIVKTYPHDPKAFTEGLFFYNNFLYESAGEYEQSTLRKVELETGKVVQQYKVPREYFGEGTTIFDNRIYQMTYQENTGFVYDADDFKLIRQFSYKGEGWGLTHDDKELIMSDGTHVIRFVSPENFQTEHTISVFLEDGKPLMNINELEYIKGEIWANVWHSEKSNILGKENQIVRIDPNSGKILGWVDFSGISPDDSKRDPENTFNGIAYDAENDRIFVTGKNWKKLFEIKVKPKV